MNYKHQNVSALELTEHSQVEPPKSAMKNEHNQSIFNKFRRRIYKQSLDLKEGVDFLACSDPVGIRQTKPKRKSKFHKRLESI